MAKFKPGQKVRCVNAKWPSITTNGTAANFNFAPVLHGIYTVLQNCNLPGYIYLSEIPLIQNGCRQGWVERAFEPATETGEEIIIAANKALDITQPQMN